MTADTARLTNYCYFIGTVKAADGLLDESCGPRRWLITRQISQKEHRLKRFRNSVLYAHSLMLVIGRYHHEGFCGWAFYFRLFKLLCGNSFKARPNTECM